MLAAVGAAAVPVYARPRVAIVPTGDELVEVNEAPAPWQIRNSNSHALAAQVRRAGGEPVALPRCATGWMRPWSGSKRR